MSNMDTKILTLALSLGIDTRNADVLTLLNQPFLSAYEVAQLLQRPRSAIHVAIDRGTLPAQTAKMGKLVIHRIRTQVALEWAATRAFFRKDAES